MGKIWSSPLLGHIIGDTVFLQIADWSKVSDYEYIEFHARAKTRLAQVGNSANVIFKDCFSHRQITCGDALCIMNDSTPDEIANRVLCILHNYWKQLIDTGMLPSQDTSAFPTNVMCGPDIANLISQTEKGDVNS